MSSESPIISANLSNTRLFEPIKVGNVSIQNRLAYAPCSRTRTTDDNVPTDSMLEYYKQRAHNNGGLLIFEATSPLREYGLFACGNSPVIETPQQVKAFKKIVDAVHAEGSFASLQLWHLGRVNEIKGLPTKGPSKVYVDKDQENRLKQNGVELEELTVEELQDIKKNFAEAAKRAVFEAGFDFIELHAAGGYFFDQFLQDAANLRTDQYGGTLENKAKMLLETIDLCIEAVGAERVAVRLSPDGNHHGSGGNTMNPIVTWGYILSELEKRAKEGKRLAYVSIIEPRFFSPDANKFEWISKIWKGVLVVAGNYLDESNIDKLGSYIDSHKNTIVAAARYFTSNPDLVNRLRNGYPLTPYDRDHFYSGPSNIGYLNFTNYGEKPDHSKDDLILKPLA